MYIDNWIKTLHYDIISPTKEGDRKWTMNKWQINNCDILTVFVRKLLKLVPQERRDELEDEFDSILLEVTEPNEKNN